MHPVLDRLVLEAVMRVLELERRLWVLSHKALCHLSGAALGDRSTAIGEYQRPRHKARLIGGREGEDVGHLLRCAAPAEYGACQRLLLHLGTHRTGFFVRPSSIDRAGADAERANAI